MPQKRFDEMLVHEMIHAYDQCARHVKWESPLHQACSEVRAASLSGECSYMREAARGNTSLQGRHRQCVKRRAGLSVAMRHGEEVASAAVDKVFEECYKDTMPFERHPAVSTRVSATLVSIRLMLTPLSLPLPPTLLSLFLITNSIRTKRWFGGPCDRTMERRKMKCLLSFVYRQARY